MQNAFLLLAMFQPVPDAAPWDCFHAIDGADSYFSVSHYLTPEGRPAGDFVGLTPGRGIDRPGRAVWRIQDRPAGTLRIEALTFVFAIPRAPASPLRLRVEADGRVVARIPVSPQIRATGQGSFGTYVLLARTPEPGFPPHGAVPEIGWPRQVTGMLEERDGQVLGTTSFPLPDQATLRAQAAEPLRLATERAVNYRRLCRNRLEPLMAPPVPRPPVR